ncbi:MAG: type I-E CRISPR-associated protein Cas6/Cse3/CasE, partial [Chlorobi bacterium]|nr:type I-E CRISPR-associated protein Cas6/Cse3/CasE [Chlorobiota bacterium]
QTLRRCFGDQHLLYRLNEADRTLLVRTEQAGDFSTLSDGYLRKAIEIAKEPTVELGSVHKLALAGNPVKQPFSKGPERGKPVALLGVGARIDWARTQLWRAGFEAIDIEIVGSQWLKSPKGINVLSVEYRGVVVVRDAEAAQAAVRRGVGRGKAWGCGMLLLT